MSPNKKQSADDVLRNIGEIAKDFAKQADERRERTHLDRADFDRLHEAGYTRVGIPTSQGGLFEDVARSTRPICEMLRTLAHGDPSVALVSAMHPAVLYYWMTVEEAPAPHTEAWKAQREEIFEGVGNGDWWGTLISEPGSGGDILKTKATAARDEAAKDLGDEHAYRMTGDKHFGSGSGQTSFMITTALPEGEPIPDIFYLETRGAAWDGSGGCKLIAEWDGHGMRATQSHAFRFDAFPARRIAWPGNIAQIAPGGGALGNAMFTAVITGIIERAFDAAQEKLAPKRGAMRSYERVEYTRAQNEAWLIRQAYEGMLREMASKAEPGAVLASIRGKMTIAELAEAALGRLCKVLGGGTFSHRAPFSAWAQDVRALGFLRPPWGLAFDQLEQRGWDR